MWKVMDGCLPDRRLMCYGCSTTLIPYTLLRYVMRALPVLLLPLLLSLKENYDPRSLGAAQLIATSSS